MMRCGVSSTVGCGRGLFHLQDEKKRRGAPRREKVPSLLVAESRLASVSTNFPPFVNIVTESSMLSHGGHGVSQPRRLSSPISSSSKGKIREESPSNFVVGSYLIDYECRC